jgi:hypothetical protein
MDLAPPYTNQSCRIAINVPIFLRGCSPPNSHNRMSIFETSTRRPIPEIHSGIACDNKRFMSECDLVNAFSTTISANKSCQVTHEFDSGYGIADIVLFSHSELSFSSLLAFSNLPEKWTYVLRCLPYRQRFSTEELQILASASLRMTRRMLESFVSAGYVKASGGDQWTKVRQPKLAFLDVTAVEAKLSDWRRALNQACRYQQFATSSWVLLDASLSRSAVAAIESFRHFNVGLATIDKQAYVEVHHRPVLEEPKSPVLHWMANVNLSRIALTANNCSDNGRVRCAKA